MISGHYFAGQEGISLKTLAIQCLESVVVDKFLMPKSKSDWLFRFVHDKFETGNYQKAIDASKISITIIVWITP